MKGRIQHHTNTAMCTGVQGMGSPKGPAELGRYCHIHTQTQHNTHTHTDTHKQTRASTLGAQAHVRNHCTADVAQGRVAAHPDCRTSPACMVRCGTAQPNHLLPTTWGGMQHAGAMYAPAARCRPLAPQAALQLFIGSHCCQRGCCMAEPTWPGQAPAGCSTLLRGKQVRR
jgi:hypothetical protein